MPRKSGYQRLISTKLWSETRALAIERDKMCVLCASIEELQVHHRKHSIPLELCFYELDNLTTLCPACHKTVTRMLKGRGKKSK